MRIGRKIIVTAIGLMLVACQSAPAPEAPADASFAWGCWVAKDEPGGRIHGFLRLLKDGPNGKLYEGYLHDVRDSDMIPLLQLAITRDGSQATIIREGRTTEYVRDQGLQTLLPRDTHKLEFLAADRSRLSLIGDGEHLALNLHNGDRLKMYAFERDGCD